MFTVLKHTSLGKTDLSSKVLFAIMLLHTASLKPNYGQFFIEKIPWGLKLLVGKMALQM